MVHSFPIMGGVAVSHHTLTANTPMLIKKFRCDSSECPIAQDLKKGLRRFAPSPFSLMLTYNYSIKIFSVVFVIFDIFPLISFHFFHQIKYYSCSCRLTPHMHAAFRLMPGYAVAEAGFLGLFPYDHGFKHHFRGSI